MINGVLSFLLALVVFSGIIYWFLKNVAQSSNDKSRGDVSPSNRPDLSATQKGVNAELVKSKWAEIEAMQNSGASGLKNALFEADKLLDYVMIQKGFSGETMGDRLKSGGSAFSNLNAVWGAHKLRNQLAHEVEHDIVPEQVKNAIQVLGAAITNLGVVVK